MTNLNDISLPHFTISWRKKTGLDVSIKSGIFPNETGVTISSLGFLPEPKIFTIGTNKVVILGNPIIGDIIDHEAVAYGWLSNSGSERFLRRLNGQFILINIDKKNKSVHLAVDRFNGIPLYWADIGDKFIASTLYFDLVKEIKRERGVVFRGESMFEFIWLQRVLGDKTHDNLSRFMKPATYLKVDKSGSRLFRYWWPDFTNKSTASDVELGEEFSALLSQSINRQTSDNRRYGLFLSGGHDSRVLLSSFKDMPDCFTVSYSDNYEVQCARDAANAVGARHHYIELPQDNLIRYQDTMSQLCGGMFATDNAFFMGFKDKVSPYADVLFHGHGLDYMFQGMYLPADTVHWFGRPTFFRSLNELKGDLISYYLTHIPFRERDIALLDYVMPKQRGNLESWMRNSVKETINEGKNSCETLNDSWEYLIVHSLGRHYSRPNIDSKMTLGEQRTISFDNDLFDFYCRLRPEMRVYAQTMRYALHRNNSKLAMIPTGNYGLPAGASPWTKTRMLITRKIQRHLTGKSGLHAPSASDRTWPDRDTYIREHKQYQLRALDAINSELLHEAMPFMNWEKINIDAKKWLSLRKRGGAKFLVSLMSLDRFLKQVE